MRLNPKRPRVLTWTISRVLLGLVLFPCAGLAQSDAEEWIPPESLRQDFDWIQLSSDEWLKGEITDLYWDTLRFDSKELDELQFDWEDVRRVLSHDVVQLALLHRVVASGRVEIDGEVIRVFDGEEVEEFPRDQLVSLTAGPPKESSYWGLKMSVGGYVRSGNTSQEDLSASLSLYRRAPRNRLLLDYLGQYNTTDEVLVADNQRVDGSWDWFLTDRLFVRPVDLQWFRDPFLNVDRRVTYSAGVGYDLIDSKRTSWIVAGGVGYQEVTFLSVEEGEDLSTDSPALIAGTDYSHEITDDIDLEYRYGLLFLDESAGRYNHHMVLGLELEITRIIDLDVSLVWDRVQEPQRDAEGTLPEQDDYRLVLGIGFELD